MVYRIDYRKRKIAPVITAFVKYKNKILLLKRSNKVGTYRGRWNVVAGFLDDKKRVREKAMEEISEEVGLRKNDVEFVRAGIPFKVKDKKINKIWVVHPILFESKTNKIKLDWEHTNYRWIFPNQLKRYKITPRLDESLRRVLG